MEILAEVFINDIQRINRYDDFDSIINKLAYYEDLEKQGLLLKLKDKYDRITIGTNVFVIIDQEKIISGVICRVNEKWDDLNGFCGEYNYFTHGQFGSVKINYDDFGKTVFLAQAEAEEALRKRIETEE